MKKRALPFLLLFVLLGRLGFAQSAEVIRKYIDTYKDIAIEEMQRTGVPAAITLAQGIHETGAGTSDLVVKSNNHFGIKCKTEWSGDKVYHDDDARGECFRKYEDAFQSYRDHSDFLKNRPYYASLFNLDPTDYEAWAYGLKKAGYATNPKYPQILIRLIQDYQLQDYTLIALGKKPADKNDPIWASTTKTVEGQEKDAKEPEPVEESPSLVSLYPSGIFQINETRVVLVAKGTAFLKVAEDNRISLSRLFEFNDMKPVDIADRDQLIYLQRKRKTGAHPIHVVEKGETLHLIAQAEGIRIENLMELNFLTLQMQPAIGERLYLHEKAPAAPKLAITPDRQAVKDPFAESSLDPAYFTHTVQSKETVFAIARRYAVTVDDVLKWNDLLSVDLKTGQQLRINKKFTNVN